MPIMLTLVVLTTLALPASAQNYAPSAARIVFAQSTAQSEAERRREQLERELQRLNEQIERERERAERDRERTRERAEQDRERAAQARERARERAEQERERARQRAERQSGPHQTERITRTLKLGPNGELDLSNIAGDITITRSTGSDVALEIIKTASGRTDEDAREQLPLVPIDIVERGNRVEVKTRYPEREEMRRTNRRNINITVDYNVAAPAGTRIRAHSISGSITATDIKGDLTLDSVSGTVRVSNGGRVAAAKSMSGNVELVDTETDGALSASSASGNVVLRRVKATRLDVGSISGNVILDDVGTTRVEAQSVSGEVRFGGPIVRNGRYELTSHSGNVHVTVAGGAGFEVEATSFSGSVRSDLPLKASGSTNVGQRERSLRGVFGDGSAVLHLTAFSGSIVITKR